MSATPSIPGHEHVLLIVLCDSSGTLLWGKGLTWGRLLAPHYRVKIQPASLYRVSKDSVCRSVAQRSSRGLVGIIHSRTSSRSPCAMGQVPHRFPWPPPVNGHNAPQACRVSRSIAGEPFCLSTFRSSTIWHSMEVTMWILMQRRSSSFARGSLFSCRIVWFSPRTCHTTSLQVLPLTKRAPWRLVKRPKKRRGRGQF
jgi:hypothetical protein